MAMKCAFSILVSLVAVLLHLIAPQVLPVPADLVGMLIAR